MLDSLKQHWRDLRNGRPGRRFQDRWKRNCQAQQAKSLRFVQPVVAVLILCAGIVFCILPGPGLPLVLIGATLMAERSRPIARTMDAAEVKLRAFAIHARRWWRHASLIMRHTAVALAAFMLAGAGYAAYRIILER